MQEHSAKCNSYWAEYVGSLAAGDPRKMARPDAFGFGGRGELADELAALVLAGKKRATASLPVEYTSLGEALPKAGDVSIILNGTGDPVAIIERTAVDLVPFHAVDPEFAAQEGEGDGSLAYWRQAHRWYFGQVCEKLGGTLEDETLVLCQRFKVVWPAQGLPRTTPSLHLRHFAHEDAPAIMTLNAEASTRRWLPSHVYASADDALSALQFLISCYSAPGHPQLAPYVLAIEHRTTGRLLGHVGFSPLGSDVEVSYAIAEAARGRGFGAESLVHACTWIADAFTVPRILAVTASANVASRRTLERASFVHAQDEDMLFQGVRQAVSRYCWHASVHRNGA